MVLPFLAKLFYYETYSLVLKCKIDYNDINLLQVAYIY